MYVVAFVEHIKVLEGIGKSSVMGPRTGKMGPQTIALFKEHKEAEQFCKDCQRHWCPGDQKDPGVRTWWYEIWDYPVLVRSNDDLDAIFIAAYNRFGKKLDVSWTPNYQTALQSEKAKKAVKGKKRK